MFTDNSVKLRTLLAKYLRESISFHDTVGEVFYHDLILGLCATFGSEYAVISNRKSGEGRYNIQIMPRDTDRTGFLFELKVEKACAPDELKFLAAAALRQINEQRYDTDMKGRGVSRIVKYGIAFSGKAVEVAIGE